MECPICLENLIGEVYSTTCGHVFCECILMSLKISPLCPSCCQPQTATQVHKLFLPSSVFEERDEIYKEIARTLELDVSIAQSKTEEVEKKLDEANEALAKLQSLHIEIVDENEKLKESLRSLEAKVTTLEEEKEDHDKTLDLSCYIVEESENFKAQAQRGVKAPTQQRGVPI